VLRMIVESSAIIHILNGTQKGRKITELYGSEITATTAICVHEVWVGVRQHERQFVHDFFQGLEILPFEAESAYNSAEIEKRLEKKGKTIGKLDVFTASIALAHGIPLITTDKDFQQVDGLNVILV